MVNKINEGNNLINESGIKQFVVDENNKHVLGGYFGLGLNNFYKTILSVFVKAGIKVQNGESITYIEENIGKILRTLRDDVSKADKIEPTNFNLTANQQVQLQKLLFHYFPMLGPIMAAEIAKKVKNSTHSNEVNRDATLAECLDVISNIAQGLVDCRNTNIHFDPYNKAEAIDVQTKIQKKLVYYLNNVFKAACRRHKDSHAATSKSLEFLTGCSIKNKLQSYVNTNKFYPHYVRENKTDKPVERKDFFYRIGEEYYVIDGKVVKESDLKIEGTSPLVLLSSFGLVYFCAMFLSKGQVKQMLSDVKLFETSPYSKEQNGIVRDIICVYHIRTPRGKKLEGSDGKVTLALDILNELRKCPRELFDVLTPEGQKLFEDKIEDKIGKAYGYIHDDVVRRIRNIDRFSHLALRYIDETKLFNFIRFQVQLGRFRFKFRDKICIDGKSEVRILQKEIKGFGRLQEIEQQRKKEYQDMLQTSVSKAMKIDGEDVNLELLQFEKDTADSEPYITDSRAFYNISNNRIGLYWSEDVTESNVCYLPKLEKVEVEGKKLGIKPEMPAPCAMLSIYDLPALLFCHYLCSETKKREWKPERIIIDKYNKLRRFFTDVSEGSFAPVANTKELEEKLEDYSLTINEIPQKLVEYLSSQKPKDQAKRDIALLKGRLVLRLQKTIRRRERFRSDSEKIDSNDNKYAKKAYAAIRYRSLAHYLSKSFLEWQPGKDKLTGLNFSKLQSALATFNSANQYKQIKNMLTSAKLLEGDIAHPFLKGVLREPINNVEDLYLKYLDAEIEFLKKFFNIKENENGIDFEKIGLNKPNVERARFPFIRGIARWEMRTEDYYKKLAQRYLKVDGKPAAIWLPDGIFTDTIVDLLRIGYAGNKALMDSMTDDKLNANAAYLITKFFELELKDCSQPFYNSCEPQKIGDVTYRFMRVYDLFNILNNTQVPVPMTSLQIKERLSKRSSEEVPNKKPKKDGNVIYKKQIIQDIDDFIWNMEDSGNYDSQEEEQNVMRRKLTRALHDVKENERAIRRYKTQDIILFLMAKRLVGEAIGMENVKVSNVFKLNLICNPHFLNTTVDFKFPVDNINGKSVYISLHDMSLKNYGEFYRLSSDDRLRSLLEKLVKVTDKEEEKGEFDYAHIMEELTSYNILRSRIFRAVHQLEKMVVSHKDFDFLYDPNKDEFYINDDRDKMAKRNNFKSLLELLEKADFKALAENERNLIISIRNAFSHNHYKVSLEDIASKDKLAKIRLIHKETGNGEKTKAENLTTIAALIVNRLEELQKEIVDSRM